MSQTLRGTWPLLGLVTVATVGPWLWRTSPVALDLTQVGAWPSAAHPLGTDEAGRDVLSRILGGARVTLLVSLLAVTTALAIGSVVGGLAGYRGGRVDAVLMRLVDAALAIPSLFVAICLLAFAGPGVGTLVLAIGITTWMPAARVVRAEVARARHEGFVEAARALGASPLQVLRNHLTPIVRPVVLVTATLGVATAILTEAALSFLGLGVQPPLPSWGNMLSGAQGSLASAPWLAIFPGTMIVVTVASVNALAESLRERDRPAR